MEKTKVSLQASEAAVYKVAGRIYAAYLALGKVAEGEERTWMERALKEAVQLAQLVDAKVQSDHELD